jgi:hypothetical protein
MGLSGAFLELFWDYLGSFGILWDISRGFLGSFGIIRDLSGVLLGSFGAAPQKIEPNSQSKLNVVYSF